MARKGNALLSLAAGFGSGYLGAQRQTKLDEERQADRDMRKEEHDARMGEVTERKNLRVSLADAARPVTVEQGAGGAIKPETMDNRDVGLPENAAMPNGGLALGGYKAGKNYFSMEDQAKMSAATQNSPDAVAKRQGAAYRQAGQPGAALEIEQKQAAITGAQMAQAKKMKEEGFIDAARASRTGDPQAVFDAFNKGGVMKLEAPPMVTPVERELPGIGKVTTYDYTARVLGPDGTPREVKVNSHDLSMQTLPFEKALEAMRKGVDTESRIDQRTGQLELGAAKLDAATARAQAAAAARTGAGGAVTREERLRYTSLFQDAGRRAGEAQKAITALQKDPEFARGLRRDQNGPQAAQLAELRDALKIHNDERATFQGMLSGSQGSAKPVSLADAEPKGGKPGARPPAPAAAKPDFSKLWK